MSVRPTPPPGSSSLDPVHNFTGFRKSTSFCVEWGERCRAMRPTPPPGSSSLDPVHNFTGFKKSASFCVKQQERMCCSIPRQRLSVRSGPGQPVDRGFSACRVPGESLFSPGSIIRKPLPAAGNMAVIQRNPMFHAEIFRITCQQSSRNGGAGESFPCPPEALVSEGSPFAVWGRRAPKDSPARGRPPVS